MMKTETGAQVRLWVQIDQQNALSLQRERMPEIDSCRCLTDTAFLIDNSDSAHAAPAHSPTRSFRPPNSAGSKSLSRLSKITIPRGSDTMPLR